jgi:hypothetical protein
LKLTDVAALPVDLDAHRSISARRGSSCMGFSFSQCLFYLAPYSHGLAAFLFQKPQAIPKPDDFSLFPGVHT